MLYAFEDDQVVFVAAATSTEEFKSFMAKMMAMSQEDLEAHHLQSADPVGFTDMLTDQRFSEMKMSPIALYFEQSNKSFLDFHQIKIVTLNNVKDRQTEMLAEDEDDPYAHDCDDNRTIGEIHNLDDDDRWDKRSDAEIENDARMRKLYEEAKKSGDLSGDDSFAPATNKKTEARITDIRTRVNPDGSVEIDHAIGVKGLYDKPKENAAIEEEISTDMAIDVDGDIAIYYKVDIAGIRISKVEEAIGDAFDLDTATAYRNSPDGCWAAFPRQMQAERFSAVLTTVGIKSKIYGVNDAGERLAPEGVEVVDTLRKTETPPRRWNDRAGELETMTDEQKAENLKTIRANEFLFCGKYHGPVRGVVLTITPASYFAENGELWEGGSLDEIKHLLPLDIEEVEPGLYQTKARDWNNVSFDMAKRGFVESMKLQMHLNLNKNVY